MKLLSSKTVETVFQFFQGFRIDEKEDTVENL
jgi:hypothetical protein